MTKSYTIFSCSLVLCWLLAGSEANAQFSITAQVRTRTELRDGFGTLALKGAKPAFFTSQRSRLTLGGKSERVIFQTSLQDVRVWEYCLMAATNSLEFVKSGTVEKSDHLPQWGYLMVNIRPEIFNSAAKK